MCSASSHRFFTSPASQCSIDTVQNSMSNFYQGGPAYQAEAPNLQFYSAAPSQSSSFYQGRPSLDPHSRQDVAGAIGSGGRSGSGAGASSLNGPIIVANWWNAFTPWTGTEGEPPLLEGVYLIRAYYVLSCSMTRPLTLAFVSRVASLCADFRRAGHQL